MMLGRRFDVDFVRRPPVPPLAGWLLVIGLAAVVAASWTCVDLWRQRTELAGARAQLDAALERARIDADRRRTAARGASPVIQAEALEILGALHRPWRALFEQLEAARAPGVHLVQVSVDARFESMQLQAEARALGDVLRYTQQLPATGPIVAVRLSSHEMRDAPVGRIVDARLVAVLGAAVPQAAAAPAASVAAATDAMSAPR